MRVFSDEDTNHIFSNRSSMEHLQNVTNNVSLKLIIKMLRNFIWVKFLKLLNYKKIKVLDK